jgi:hypothetical protein
MFAERDRSAARPLWLVTETQRDAWLAAQDDATRSWLAALNFKAERHQVPVSPTARRRARPCSASVPSLTSTS